MELAMEDMTELQFSACSSTCSTTIAGEFPWNDWLPDMDWKTFAGGDDDLFKGLFEPMVHDSDELFVSLSPNDWSSTNVSPSTTTWPGTPVEESPPVVIPSATSSPGMPEQSTSAGEDAGGLRLVHLLMAAAEALTGGHKNLDLARVILARLKELTGCTVGGATAIERLAGYFTDALQGILNGSDQQQEDRQNFSEVLEAFQLLQDMSPCVKFGHFTANQAIVEAVAGERRVHVVDYDIMEGVQWASLMQALVSRSDGQTLPHLRITAVTRAGAAGSRPGTVQETGRRLAAFAASVGLPFSFGQCRLESDDRFRPEAVKTVKGEAVVLNCSVQRSAGSVGSFLAGASVLGARLVTLVEEEVARDEEEGGFVGFFMEELKRYSAIWDSLEAGFPMQGRAREAMERLVLGPRIARAVRRAFRRLKDGEVAAEGWLEAAGFQRVGLSFFNVCQARLLLGLFNDGYRVEEDEPNKLVLSWKSCRLLSASVWSAPPPPSPAPTNYSFQARIMF
ncbi:Nodulation-signaling pathway 2 protein [Apostasia shenzhenica]|uniref:Nodulation-signaling pathway 2 protein n=1 Tax=Apostasia shenzhenica TaxID=1088818 RepID=A0A2I0B7L1_9ASPA|nr:Nodulation-signaling pathway 2 protein [Apostasia shenzhenica]